MSFIEFLRTFKATYEVFNFFNRSKLFYLKKAYQKYGIKRPLYRSVNADFLSKNASSGEKEKPWLDELVDLNKLKSHHEFSSFNTNEQGQLINFAEKGYAVLSRYFSEETVDAINKEIERLLVDKEIGFRYSGTKIMFANKYSSLIKGITQDNGLLRLVSFILRKKAIPFQTINFLHGSRQRAHSDSIHMTTYPLGFLAAAWVALEDIHADSGPLFYYPGSHKLPYILNNDYNSGSTEYRIGENAYKAYENKIQEVIDQNKLQSETFLAKKGDVFIWHANLLHGGSPVVNAALTRKSMVIHYYAEDVICYHEITQRPALLEL